jgi:hypothetical protein
LVADVRSRLRFLCPHRLSILDRIDGPEPPTPADLEREADHERHVRAFPEAGEALKPENMMPGKIGTAK